MSSQPSAVSTQPIRIMEAFVRLEDLLTPRQFEIAGMVRDGHNNRVISELTGLSENTVKKYLWNIFLRLRCDCRVTLAVRYERENPKSSSSN